MQHSSRRRRRDLLLFSQLRLLKDARFLTTECLSYVSGGQQLGAGVRGSQRALSCSASFDDPGILNQTMSGTLFFLIADGGFTHRVFYSFILFEGPVNTFGKNKNSISFESCAASRSEKEMGNCRRSSYSPNVFYISSK